MKTGRADKDPSALSVTLFILLPFLVPLAIMLALGLFVLGVIFFDSLGHGHYVEAGAAKYGAHERYLRDAGSRSWRFADVLPDDVTLEHAEILDYRFVYDDTCRTEVQPVYYVRLDAAYPDEARYRAEAERLERAARGRYETDAGIVYTFDEDIFYWTAQKLNTADYWDGCSIPIAFAEADSEVREIAYRIIYVYDIDSGIDEEIAGDLALLAGIAEGQPSEAA